MYNELIAAGSRRLQNEPGEPQLKVEGGGNVDVDPGLRKREPDQDRLDEYEAVMLDCGPVASLVNARSQMTFGVGTEWITREDDVVREVDGREMTAADYLESRLATRRRDTVLPRIGRQCYWAGNGFVEYVRDRAGRFAELDPVNPKTIEVLYDDTGQIQEWVQNTRASRFGDELSQRVDDARLAHFTLYRNGRNPLGHSIVGQNWEYIERYRENQQAIQKALEAHAFVKWHVLAHGPLDDRDIRRIRQRFNDIRNENTYVTAEDIEINPLDTGGIGEGIDNIAKRDVQNLAMGFFFPIEWTQWSGSDGLGTGKPAEGRRIAFENQAKAEQRALTGQFLEQVARPIIEESPFPDDVHVDLSWGDVIADNETMLDQMQKHSWALHRDEVREALDLPAWDDGDAREAPPELDPKAERGGDGGGLLDGMGLGGRDSDFRHLNRGEPWERTFDRLYEHVLWSEETDRALFEFDPDEVPQFVVSRLEDAVRAGALFGDFDTIPDWAADQVQDVMLDSLETQHGWSVDSIAENLQSMALGLDRHDAEVIARTETQALVNKAREEGYREEFDLDEERFQWVGPDDNRTTDACEWIKAQVPDDGVSLDRLKELIQEAPEHDADVNTEPREFSPHISCRHTYTRVV